MARSSIENIDINLFEDDFKKIGQEFLQSIVSIFSFFTFKSPFKKQFLLMTENATYAYGDQICSWLSLGHDRSKPQRIYCLDDMKIVQVDYGRNFVAILTDDGQVFLASNVKSKWETNKTLRLISNDNDQFKMIACGWSHLLLLRHDGHVFAMGHNGYGQITGNEKSSYQSMIHIDNLENVELIVCGFDRSFSLTNKGKIYSWGRNGRGQLGLGDAKNRNTPCLVAYPNADLINIRIKDIVAGYQHSLFLFENGQLWGCGSNYAGELGLGDENNRSILTKIPIENVQQIACSTFHNFSLAHDGSSYYAWGATNYDEWLSPKKLDDSHSSFASASVQILNSPLTFGPTLIIHPFGSHDSKLYQCRSIIQLFNNQDSYDVEFIIEDKRIKGCKCYLKSVSKFFSDKFSDDWKKKNQVMISGYSYNAYNAYLRMLHSGKIHINRQNITEFVDLANCYGDEKLMKYCETFIQNDLNEQTMPTYLPLIKKYEIKELHDKFRNKIMARSPIENIDIDLFQYGLKKIDQEFLQSVVSIFELFPFSGTEIEFLLMTKEATYAYGEVICSCLSLEHDMSKPQRISLLNDTKIVQVDSSHDFVVILTDEGQVFIASDVDSKWETNKTLRLISNENDRFKMIVCGGWHLLLLRQDGHVFAMGYNSCGQITGNEKSSYESMIHIDNLENVELIACGEYHSLSITNKGEIYSWGDNDFGQLGLGDEKKRNTPCLIPFPNDDSTRIKDIVAGKFHSLFLFENGQLWECGSNSDGELGLGDDIKRSKLTKIPIENVQQIACSKFDSFSLAHDGSSYYAWGKTENGKWSSPRKLDDHPTSFVAASAMILSSPLTFGLTSTIYAFGSHDSISYQFKLITQLFDNQDNYDVEFIIDEKRIKASKCYLKSISKYYRGMFSENWSENNQVIIENYSYETYYEYLRMLHIGKIEICQRNLTEFVDLANFYGDERLMEYCETFIRNDLNEQTMPTYRTLISKYEMKELDYEIGNMTRPPTETIDIELFEDDFENINQEFLQSVVSIFSFFPFLCHEMQFLLMTKDATYAYGKEICSWLSLKHDMNNPQQISLLNDVKIVQVDYGCDFVAILTDEGQVFLANDVDSKWKTKRTLRLISNHNDRFKMIACGWSHLLMLRQDGHVFAMGDNICSQITGNEESSYQSMKHIDNLENVKLIVCGGIHSLSITNKGEIYSWGDNDFGQLGLGDEENRNTPCFVAFQNDDSIDIRIKDIMAGPFFSLFLFENDQLWGCGFNKNGELGLGDDIKRSKLTKIPIENVQQIACSKFHRFSLAHDGSSYYAWGKTENGKWSSPRKLDDSHSSFASASALLCNSPHTFGLTSIIHEFKSHDPISYQCKSIIQLFDNQDIYDVEFKINENRIKACKCYLKSASEYFCRMFSGNWIENNQVIINDYSYETYYAYLRMLHTGKIYINLQNITELVDLANCYGDEKLLKYCETFIRNEQTMPTYLPLINKYEMSELQDKLRNKIIARSPNENIYIDLFQYDFIYIDQEFFQSVGSIFSFILEDKNEFLLMTKEATYAYGEEICSWLSLGHDRSKPQRIYCLDDMKIVQVDYGRNFVAILTDDGQVFLASNVKSKWETNKTLRLISNDDDCFKMIACGQYHLLLLRQDGHVFAMGGNIHGQITGYKESSYESIIHIDNLENVKLIVCGGLHSLSITNKGEIYSWGLNSCVQLGLGDAKNRNTPCLVAFQNDDSIDIRIKDIMAGPFFSLFLFENGQLWGCGSNNNGELGLGDDINRSKLTKIPIENVQQIACSKFHRFSLAYDGSSYYAWGNTENGKWSSPRKLDDSHSSFASASVQVLNSPITFGPTLIIHPFGSLDSISYQTKSIIQLFDNQDSYDVEFIIEKKRIKMCKCYLKSVSEYYRRMFSGNWSENDQVIINNYSYETYYAYLRMLHTGKIYINRQNITELVDLANCYGDEKLMKYCKTFTHREKIRYLLNNSEKYCLLIFVYIDGFESFIMARLTDNFIDNELFQNIFEPIDQEFVQIIEWIYSLLIHQETSKTFQREFLLMTNDATTYAYGEHICSWLSLKHDITRPQKISILDDMKIVQVDSGLNFVTFLTEEGHVYVASNVSNWQTNNTCRLISTGNDRFKMIACGFKHLLLLRQDGVLFTMGNNTYGQLTGSFLSSFESMVKIDLKNVKLIICGRNHSLALTDEGKVYSWGKNDCGQLGLGDKNNRNNPFPIVFPHDSIYSQIIDIAAGPSHSLFLLKNGQLLSCGYNYDDQPTMIPNNYQQQFTIANNNEQPIRFNSMQLLSTRLQKKKKLESKLDDILPLKPIKIPIENVQKIACSKFYFFSLAHDGSSYYVWGETKSGIWSSPRKLNGRPKSFSASSAMILESPITFGLTSRIKIFEFHESISTKSIIRLFNNPDNYDVKFVIGDRRILACKCYLKSVSDYYCLMFSGAWKEKVEVEIRDYSYETYYAYLRMLHYDCIGINQNMISQLIDLATCYIDKRLMKHCKTFIRDDLNEQTMPTYLQLISKYEIKELYDKLSHITIEQVLPKVTDSILQNNENSIEFLNWFYNQRRPFISK
ncbi:hypothetical protein HUG17_9332 [Dermatophagoides farinae]|uniref:BTB domain-containing protein n=1 Tax=Dermatophagoides farinae TaxID=6954 RepID=A0A9D4SE06_DERFA|nr:hypothetical protein HUG17_9332 [Dermatophagoides farinae]